jgi:hypothetical protein
MPVGVERRSINDQGRAGSWSRQDHSDAGDAVSLSSLGIAVTLDDIYAGVTPASPSA